MTDALTRRIADFIRRHDLFTARHRLLLAVSGGVDSVVMTHILNKRGYRVGIAHCNFKLRREASDGDAAFVRQLAARIGAPYFERSFDTRAYAARQGLSVQVAARELRYAFFDELIHSQGFDRLVTAHHATDFTETVLLNMLRGTGIRGLHGIPARNGYIVRPLLAATRQELDQYAREQRLRYREDASNADTKYRRNRLRHNVLPELRALNPALETTFTANAERLALPEYLYRQHIERLKANLLRKLNGRVYINRAALQTEPFPAAVLYELLTDYGFSADQANRIAEHLPDGQGQLFPSDTHELLIDRENLILREIAPPTAPVRIAADQEAVRYAGRHFTLSRHSVQTFSDLTAPTVGYFDADKLQFPLTLRPPQPNDRFRPLGMTGSKLLSDFFTDLKLSRFDKENIPVLTDATGAVLWIIGYRPDDRFKLTGATRRVLRLAEITDA